MTTAADVLASQIAAWVEDPDSDVTYAEQLDGRWAVRMRQRVRDATTVWWQVGERTVRCEAYVLPAPLANHAEVYRLCLVRNQRTWRVRFALDEEGAVVLRGRLGVAGVTPEALDLTLGEIYDLVEISFRPLVRLAFPPRETST